MILIFILIKDDLVEKENKRKVKVVKNKGKGVGKKSKL